jgi:hypothetical protein
MRGRRRAKAGTQLRVYRQGLDIHQGRKSSRLVRARAAIRIEVQAMMRAPLIGSALLLAGCAGPRPASNDAVAVAATMPRATASSRETTTQPLPRQTRWPDNRWLVPRDCAAEERSRRKFNGLKCELNEELRAYVVERQDCSTSSQCIVVTTRCPFGCGIPIAERHVADVATMYVELAERFRAAGVDCKYQCLVMTDAVCEKGRCRGTRPPFGEPTEQ